MEPLTALMGTSIVVVVLALDPNGLVAALHRVASCKGTGPGRVGILARHCFLRGRLWFIERSRWALFIDIGMTSE